MSSLETVLAFIHAINQHDVRMMCDLMTNDHLFTDSLGGTVRGKDELRKAWISYFYLVPDFHITCSEMLQRGGSVGLFGKASGTCKIGKGLLPENAWEIPASWRAAVKDGRVSEWQTYADNEPVRIILARSPEGTPSA
jgi:ketosteroid isomerase-like protein